MRLRGDVLKQIRRYRGGRYDRHSDHRRARRGRANGHDFVIKKK